MKSRKDKKTTGQTIDVFYHRILSGLEFAFDKEMLKITSSIIVSSLMYLISFLNHNGGLFFFAVGGSVIWHLMMNQLFQEERNNNQEKIESAAMMLSLAKRAQKAGDKNIKIEEWEEDGKAHFLIELGKDEPGMMDNGWKVHPDHFKEGGIFHDGKD